MAGHIHSRVFGPYSLSQRIQATKANDRKVGVVVGTIDFFLLGPLEARQRERPLRLGSIKHRMLLAKLLLHPNQVVSTEELIVAVWGEEPPPTVKQSLQNHVAALRKSIEAGNGAGPPRTLVTRDPGYLLRVDPERLDLHRFQRLDREGRQALSSGDPARAADLLRQALALWRGPALADVAASADLAWPELVGVEELQVASTEARIEAELALGRHHELVAELEALVRLYPLREHLHGQLMLALYRSGRQADALAAYRAARRVLVDELGIEPSVGLQRLEQAILAQDPALDLLVPARSGDPEAHDDRGPPDRGDGTTTEGGGSVERKLVSVLFAEVDEPLGEADRDPEDVSSMLDRHLDRVRAEIESFGGTVEHAIGGITMATFGVPQTREDDPERAVRAALAIRDALSMSRRRGGAAGRRDHRGGAGHRRRPGGRRPGGHLRPAPAGRTQRDGAGVGGDRPGHRALDQLRPGQPARPGRAGPADDRVERTRAPQPHRHGRPGRRAGAADRPRP